MDARAAAPEPPPTSLEEFRVAVAEDLRCLAELHDREPTAELLSELKAIGYPKSMGLCLTGEAGRQASAEMLAALSGIDPSKDEEVADVLAADYADIYLTHGCRAAPTESVWLDEDNLERQVPMFEVREWYLKHDLAAADWQRRPDDHIVPQLQFIAYLMQYADGLAGLSEVADFMDHHLLKWIPDFSARVASRCDTRYFAGLALLTSAYLDELRDLLAEITDQARPEGLDGKE